MTQKYAGDFIQFRDGTFQNCARGGVLCTVAGTANTIELTTGLNLTSIPFGQVFRFSTSTRNTATITSITIDGNTVPAKTVVGADLPADYIRDDVVDTMITIAANGDGVVSRDVERGSNSNGEFEYRADGTLICSKVITGLGPVTTTWGSLFISSPITSGDLAQEFISPPVVQMSAYDNSNLVYIGGTSLPTTTTFPNFYLIRGSSSGDTDFVAHLTAFGGWY